MAITKTGCITVHPRLNIHFVTTSPSPDERHISGGPTLLFLHYWGGSSRTWSPVISHLSNYRTLAVDFRGWGFSNGPSEPNAYGISDLAEDVIEVIRKSGTEDFVIVGHSMGAKVAQLIAGRIVSRTETYPDLRKNLKGLVLISPAPPSPLTLPEDMIEQQLHAYDDHKSAEFVARNVLSATELKTETVASLVGDMLKGNKWARAAWPAYAMSEDISDQARLIEVPCLVIAAGKDMVEPEERVRAEVVERLKLVNFVIIKDSGHLSPVEAPESVTDYLLKFLKFLYL